MNPTERDFSKNRLSQPQEKLLDNQLDTTWPIRVIYCLALLGLVLGSLNRGSWVGLALGGGLAGWGKGVFLIVTIGAVFRSYLVVRYKATLRARKPNTLGLTVRGLGILVMLAGTIGLLSMFLVKPVTLFFLKSGGPNGIAFFAVALYATLLSSAGWVGCLLFELSRLMGKRSTSKKPSKTGRDRKQDLAVAVSIAALVIGARFSLRFIMEQPCYGPTAIHCVASIDGGVTRPAVAAYGSVVSMTTNIDEVVFLRQPESSKGVKESPAFSLLKAGHPAEGPAVSEVRLELNVAPAAKGVAITLKVFDAQGESASFVTTITEGAHLESGKDGKRKVVINLPKKSHLSMSYPLPDPITQQSYVLDEIFRQMRQAIVSPREAAELSRRISKEFRGISAVDVPATGKIDQSLMTASCNDVIKIVNVGDNETALRPSAGTPLRRLIFSSVESPDSYALVQVNDRIGCNSDGVWAFNILASNGNFEIRRFSNEGQLLNFVSITLPIDKLRALPDLESGKVIGDKMTFTTLSISKPNLWTRRIFEIDL